MIYAAEAGNFVLGLVGDVMLTRRVSIGQEENFLALRSTLLRADAVFANLESSVRRSDQGTPGITAGTHMTMPPELLDELGSLGISVVSTANNHAMDFGEGGILATLEHLRAANIPFAGTGANLAEARAPAYLDTSRGRVAVVALTSTFRPWNRAGAQGPRMTGRPGVNPLGFTTRYGVDGEAFAALQRISEALGFDKAHKRDRQHFFSDRDIGRQAADTVGIAGQVFFEADAFALQKQADETDMKANLRAISEARRQADWVIVSVHSHEVSGERQMNAQSRSELDEPAEFIRDFAHAAIDAGADVVAGHGSHTLLGIEIYKDLPIFYSLGNFVFMNETVPAFPADAYERFGLAPDATPSEFLDARTNKDTKGHPASPDYWRSVVASCSFHGGKLAEVVLDPIDLGFGQPRHRRGRPGLAEGGVREDILARLERLSAPYGTPIERRNGQAVVRLSDSSGI